MLTHSLPSPSTNTNTLLHTLPLPPPCPPLGGMPTSPTSRVLRSQASQAHQLSGTAVQCARALTQLQSQLEGVLGEVQAASVQSIPEQVRKHFRITLIANVAAVSVGGRAEQGAGVCVSAVDA